MVRKQWEHFHQSDYIQEFSEQCVLRIDDVRRQAERLLLTRTQRIGEKSELYIHVLSLCWKGNFSMLESKKVAHLLKDISEDLYQIFLIQELKTVEEFV